MSEKINQRFLTGLISQIWVMPLLIALALIPARVSAWTKWVLATLVVGHPYVHAVCLTTALSTSENEADGSVLDLVAITSRNAGTVKTRTVASALYNMCVQASSIIAQNVSSTSAVADSLHVQWSILTAQIYRDDDKPLYRR